MSSQVAVSRITSKLGATETAIDALLANQAELFSTVVHASLDTSTPLSQTQHILMRLTKAQQSIIGARGDLIRSHSQLLKVGQERGDILDGDCPPQKAVVQPQLQAVA